jgi:hypothetical protein
MHDGNGLGPESASWTALLQLFARGRLIVSQKSFNEFTLAANDHPPKPFEPAVARNVRLASEPFGKCAEILDGNVPSINPIKQVLPQIAREVVSAHSRHADV